MHEGGAGWGGGLVGSVSMEARECQLPGGCSYIVVSHLTMSAGD